MAALQGSKHLPGEVQVGSLQQEGLYAAPLGERGAGHRFCSPTGSFGGLGGFGRQFAKYGLWE